MNKAILMNIGNSNTQIAVWKEECIHLKKTLQTRALAKELQETTNLKDLSGLPCVAACVVPIVREQLMEIKMFSLIHWVSASMELELDFSLIDQSTLGADRVANSVAAIHEISLPTIILDCGTAITTEVINNQKQFLGGSITPGRHLARLALNQSIGQLPMIPFSKEIPQPMGRNTADAITSGVDLGVLGAIQRILFDIRRTVSEPELTTIAIGGDRHFFAKNLEQVRLGREDFTLKGLAHIAQTL